MSLPPDHPPDNPVSPLDVHLADSDRTVDDVRADIAEHRRLQRIVDREILDRQRGLALAEARIADAKKLRAIRKTKVGTLHEQLVKAMSPRLTPSQLFRRRLMRLDRRIARQEIAEAIRALGEEGGDDE
jgi:hypothetical protein